MRLNMAEIYEGWVFENFGSRKIADPDSFCPTIIENNVYDTIEHEKQQDSSGVCRKTSCGATFRAHTPDIIAEFDNACNDVRFNNLRELNDDSQTCAEVQYMNVGRLDHGMLNVDRLDDVGLNVDRMDDLQLNVVRLDDSRLNVGRVDDSLLNVNRLDGSRLNVGRLDESRLTVGCMDESRLNVGRLDESRLNVGRLDKSRLNVGRLDESRLNVGRLDESRLNVGRLDESRLNGARLDDSRLSVGRMDGWKVDDTTLDIWRPDGRLMVLGLDNSRMNDSGLNEMVLRQVVLNDVQLNGESGTDFGKEYLYDNYKGPPKSKPRCLCRNQCLIISIIIMLLMISGGIAAIIIYHQPKIAMDAMSPPPVMSQSSTIPLVSVTTLSISSPHITSPAGILPNIIATTWGRARTTTIPAIRTTKRLSTTYFIHSSHPIARRTTFPVRRTTRPMR